ncbi:MAG: ATP-binding protein [Dehalococcoidia bacterium]
MEFYHKASKKLFFGYRREIRAARVLAQFPPGAGNIVMLHGPPGTGKTEFIQQFFSFLPQGSTLVYENCAQAINNGSFEETCFKLDGILRVAIGNVPLMLALDEMEIVAVRREPLTIATMGHTLRITGLLQLAPNVPQTILALCTNTPCIVDDSVGRRCTESIYLSYATGEVIEDALLHIGYPNDLIPEATRLWVGRLEVEGWWRGSQLIPAILKNASSIINLSPVELVDYLDSCPIGPRVKDSLRYERMNAEWIVMARRTLERWAP